MTPESRHTDQDTRRKTRQRQRLLSFLFFAVLILLTVARLLIGLRLSVHIYPSQIYDDKLLYDYAENLLNGKWLGETYTKVTMAKGMSYALFLAICNRLWIPYTLGFGLLNVGAALTFVQAIRPRFSNRYALGVMYTLMLFAPMAWSNTLGQRTYRNTIVPYLALLAFACLIGLYFRKKKKPAKLIPWAVGTGLSFSFLWFVREDSIWILPFLAVVLLVMAICIGLQKIHLRQKIKKWICTALPALSLVLCILLVSLVNYLCYGVALTNDRNGGEFAAAMKYLYAMDGSDDLSVWVPYKNLELAMQVSPTLNSIQDEIYSNYHNWSGGADTIKGDLVTWALRDAAEEAGYYQDNAPQTEAFWRQVGQELADGFESGALKASDSIHISSGIRGLTQEEIPSLLKKALKRMGKLLVYGDTEVGMPYGSGSAEEIREVEAMLGVSTLYPTTWQLTLSGSLTSEKAYSVALIDSAGAVLWQQLPNEDLSQPLTFTVSLADLSSDQLSLRLEADGEDAQTIALESAEAEDYTLSLDEVTWTANTDPATEQVTSEEELPQLLHSFYTALSPVAVVLAVIGYVLQIFRLVWQKRMRRPVWPELENWLIVTGLALSTFVLCFGVEFFCSWFEDDQNFFISFYACAGYSLFMMAKYLSVYMGVRSVLAFWRQRRSSLLAPAQKTAS